MLLHSMIHWPPTELLPYLAFQEHPLHLHKGLLYTGHRYSLDVVRHGQRGPAIQEDFEYLVVIAVGGQDKGRDVHGEGGLGAVHRLPALPKDQK